MVTKASLQFIRQASKKNTAQEPIAHWLSRTEENGEQPAAEQNEFLPELDQISDAEAMVSFMMSD